MYDIAVEIEDGVYAVKTPFSQWFVDALKICIPANDRRFVKTPNRWLIAPQHGAKITELIRLHYGVTVTLPAIAPMVSTPSIQLLRVEYIGACKDRNGEDERTAYGFSNNSWSVLFPESVLRAWFQDATTPAEQSKPQTLYQIMNLKQDASAEEIKKTYRRLALHTHPDHNREPDAEAQFKKLNAAYKILSDPLQKRKYDIGLRFTSDEEARHAVRTQFTSRYNDVSLYGYKPPMRCGLILGETIQTGLGQYRFISIQMWSDITNQQGQTMVSSWPTGATTFEVRWI